MAETARGRPKRELFREIYARFDAPIARYDCGRKCAPLNGGEPVCCTTSHAIPVVDKEEFRLLKTRTDIWSRFQPFDAASQAIVDDLHPDCAAIACKGARFCERDNRSLACRSFPFFPYLTRTRELIGLSYYWSFEDRCWVISNLRAVERRYVKQMIAAHELLFEEDPEQRDVFFEQSAAMRRVFSRWRRPIPIIGREGGFFEEMPHGGGLRPAKAGDFAAHGPYVSERAYRRAIIEAGGD